jgi:hypothetical protein
MLILWKECYVLIFIYYLHVIQLTSVLEISTGYRLPPQQLSNYSDQEGDVLDSAGDQQQQALDPRSSQAQEDIVKAQLRAAKLKRSRALNEPCVIPNKLLHRVDVSSALSPSNPARPLGCDALMHGCCCCPCFPHR